MRFIPLFFALLVSCVSSLNAQACDALPEKTVNTNGIHACSAWVRLSPPAIPITAAYVVLHNGGTQDDVLTSVTTPLSERVELHETTETNGISQMRPFKDGIKIAKDSMIEMKPGGIHIMLMGLKEPLTENQVLPLTLNFAKRPPMVLNVSVKKNVSAPADSTSHKHH